MFTIALKPMGAAAAVMCGLSIAFLAPVQAGAQDRILVSRSGDAHGSSVVYVPGLATPGAVYDAFVSEHQDWDNHVVTLAGFGRTPAPDPLQPFVEGAAEALARYLDRENIEDAVLVGHSMGAQIALIAAGRAPERIDHVVVVDSAPFFAGLMQPGATPQMMAPRAAAIRERMSAPPREAYLDMMAQGLPIQAMSGESQSRIMGWIEDADQEVVAVATAELTATDFTPHLAAVQAPVTLLYAEFPEMEPAQIRARFLDQYEGEVALEARGVADSRHFIMLDQPARFAAEIERVVEGD